MELILQEVSTEREIEIPKAVRDVYRLWRPTPLFRARHLEAVLQTPAKIFYKYEGVSPTGSHKPNTAVPQAYYNKQSGISKLTTETGAGQWGSSLAFAGNVFGLSIDVYMVRVLLRPEAVPARVDAVLRRALRGLTVRGDARGPRRPGRAPDHPGSLGLAISEAVEMAAQRADTKYSLGSVLNHVLMHQSVIGLEAMEQMEMAGEYPDIIFGCTGGGSNFAGLRVPVHRRAVARRPQGRRSTAVEPAACPSLTKGKYAYDFGDVAKLTPLMKTHTLGSSFTPPGFHAGGLRYHGMAPQVSHLKKLGLIDARAYQQTRLLRSRRDVRAGRGHRAGARSPTTRCSGAIDEAIRCREEGTVARHPVQPQRPRPLRHGRLHRLLHRQAAGHHLRRGRPRDGAGRTAGGGVGADAGGFRPSGDRRSAFGVRNFLRDARRGRSVHSTAAPRWLYGVRRSAERLAAPPLLSPRFRAPSRLEAAGALATGQAIRAPPATHPASPTAAGTRNAG